MGYLNKFTTESEYSSATLPTDSSSVSLVTGTNSVKYDGVNCVVKVPKVGDAVYVPTACKYGAASVPSGTAEGSATFIAGETLNASLMPSDLEAVGVVVAVKGRNAYVLWKANSGKVKFCSTATSGGSTVDEAYLSASDYTKVLASNVRDSAGRIGWRSCCSVPVLASCLSGADGKSWNGGTEADGTSFYTAAEWGWTSGGPTAGKTVPTSYYEAYEEDPATPTEAGWLRYLESRMIQDPSRSKYNLIALDDGREVTEVWKGVNEAYGAENSAAYILPAHWATEHSVTWGGFGDFFNISGMKYGEWFMPGFGLMKDIFKGVSYAIPGTTRESDPINRTLYRIGGQALQLFLPYDDYIYWCPLLYSRSRAWSLNAYGFFTYYCNLYSTFRALSCALLEF